MTLQDDLARHWFQPLVPNGAQQHPARPKAGPLTTRFTGELALDDAEFATAGTRQPAAPPRPARVEVTQPYIPAIRDKPPEFAKRLGVVDPPTPSAPPVRPAPPEPVGTAPPATEPPKTSETPPASASTAAPPKRRSLVRRVVRRIIGPDLLRKDPAPRRR